MKCCSVVWTTDRDHCLSCPSADGHHWKPQPHRRNCIGQEKRQRCCLEIIFGYCWFTSIQEKVKIKAFGFSETDDSFRKLRVGFLKSLQPQILARVEEFWHHEKNKCGVLNVSLTRCSLPHLVTRQAWYKQKAQIHVYVNPPSPKPAQRFHGSVQDMPTKGSVSQGIWCYCFMTGWKIFLLGAGARRQKGCPAKPWLEGEFRCHAEIPPFRSSSSQGNKGFLETKLSVCKN